MPLLLSHPRYRYAPTVPSSSDSHPETAIVVVGSDAALRSLGRSGVAELLESCCAHARHFAEALAQEPGVEVLNDVVLNQVLVRFLDPGGDHDARTRAVVKAVQEDGTCWLGGTTWQGRAAMRISVSNWSTTAEDVERSVAAILHAAN